MAIAAIGTPNKYRVNEHVSDSESALARSSGSKSTASTPLANAIASHREAHRKLRATERFAGAPASVGSVAPACLQESTADWATVRECRSTGD